MSHSLHPHDSTATRVAAGAAWIDSGAGLGLIVVDSNRPAIAAGSARALRMQFVAAHH